MHDLTKEFVSILRLHIMVERTKFVRYSGTTEKAYAQAYTMLQNVRPKLDARELAVQFGCTRLAETVQKTLST